MTILFCGAHPDDAEISSFGLLLAARARGDAVTILVATDGGRGGARDAGDPATLAARRRAEAERAARPHGIELVFLDEPDGALHAAPPLVARLEAEIARIAPTLVVTHAPEDYHPDHRALAHAVRDAARFHVPVLFSDTLAGVGFLPTILLDVTAHFDAKRAAIRAHASQAPERFVRMAEAQNRLRAFQSGADPMAEPLAYAEAYRFEPVWPFGDVRHLLPG